jgi:HSP20 family protein
MHAGGQKDGKPIKEAHMTITEMTRPQAAMPAPIKAAPAPVSRRVTPFDLLQNEIDRVFNSFNNWPAAFTDTSFSPSMEVTETDAAIEVSIELPGMDEKDIDISVADGVLTIRGEKKFERDEKKKNYRVVERSYGSFERAVALPQVVDAAKVKAQMSKGVLKIDIPKPLAAKAQQVKIRSE